MKPRCYVVKMIVVVLLETTLLACNNRSSEEIDVLSLSRLEPDTAQIGDEVTVFGSGFSSEEDNILLVGGIAIVNTDWDLSSTGREGEEEQITFTVIEEVELGEQELVVMSEDKTSNPLILTVIE